MKTMICPRPPFLALTAAVAILAACGGKGDSKPAAGNAAPPATAAGAPAATGKIITIEMFSDEKGNRFVPSEVEAHRGDLLRFTVGVGVHNVIFLPDSNPGVPNLPEASEMLQLPGQNYDVPVTFAAGKTYFFQCTPHALLGMQGHLKVVD